MEQNETSAVCESNLETLCTSPREARSTRPRPPTFLECESPDFYTNKETLTPVTPGYLPPISLLTLSDYSFTETVPESEKEKQQEAVEALNDFLKARDISPIRQCLRKSWQDASERTRREHLRKICQSFTAVVNTVAPGQENDVWNEIGKSSQFNFEHNREIFERESLAALRDAYDDAEEKSTKRLIKQRDICWKKEEVNQ